MPIKNNTDKLLLIFDVETTGMPKNWKGRISDTNNWPRVVQIAWSLVKGGGEVLVEESRIIKPGGFTIPMDSTKVHGITTEMAIAQGVNLETVLQEFEESLNRTDYLVAHNIDFDYKVLGCEYHRVKNRNVLEGKPQICTMKTTTNYCAIPGRYGNKWPSLSELYNKVFHKHLEGAHDALVDVRACRDCLLYLSGKGIISY